MEVSLVVRCGEKRRKVLWNCLGPETEERWCRLDFRLYKIDQFATHVPAFANRRFMRKHQGSNKFFSSFPADSELKKFGHGTGDESGVTVSRIAPIGRY